MEDKQRILDLLLPALQATNNLHNLLSLVYDADKKLVVANFPGGTKTVNAAMDSGTAMIWYVIGQIV